MNQVSTEPLPGVRTWLGAGDITVKKTGNIPAFLIRAMNNKAAMGPWYPWVGINAMTEGQWSEKLSLRRDI